MKKLIVVRHAKSNWDLGWGDKDRPLKTKGIMRAKNHAILLKENLDFVPEYWASSYAIRALHTATIFAEEFDHVNNIKVQKELYTFSTLDILRFIQNIPNVIDSAIIFGHNDACLEVINELTDAGLTEFKTSACAIMNFNMNRWQELSNGKIINIITKNKII